MRFADELGFELVTVLACAPTGIFARVLRQRIAALDHETLDDSMKRGAVVKTFFGERLEIFDSFGSDLRPEFNYHVALGRLDDRNLLAARLGGRYVGRFGVLLFCFFLVGLREGGRQAKQ